MIKILKYFLKIIKIKITVNTIIRVGRSYLYHIKTYIFYYIGQFKPNKNNNHIKINCGIQLICLFKINWCIYLKTNVQ